MRNIQEIIFKSLPSWIKKLRAFPRETYIFIPEGFIFTHRSGCIPENTQPKAIYYIFKTMAMGILWGIELSIKMSQVHCSHLIKEWLRVSLSLTGSLCASKEDFSWNKNHFWRRINHYFKAQNSLPQQGIALRSTWCSASHFHFSELLDDHCVDFIIYISLDFKVAACLSSHHPTQSIALSQSLHISFSKTSKPNVNY